MDKDLIDVWKTSRGVVEALDKSIWQMRVIFLTVMSALATVAASILSREATETTIFYLAGTVIGFSVIMWNLDDRYHGYLCMAAKTCRNIENDLGLSDKQLGVSIELERLKGMLAFKDSRYKIIRLIRARLSYDGIYLSVAIGAAVAASLISGNGHYLGKYLIIAVILFDIPMAFWIIVLLRRQDILQKATE